VPYLTILPNCTKNRELNDIYSEFFILEDSSITTGSIAVDFNAIYWDNKYTIRSSSIPVLFAEVANKILITGKYLNVVRGLKNTINTAPAAVSTTVAVSAANTASSSSSSTLNDLLKIRFDLSGDYLKLTSIINSAYSYSSHALLQILENNYNIYLHLRSLRRFFLLENGDFFVQFMDIAKVELRKNINEVALSRVQNLLSQAVLSSTLSNDPNKEELTCYLAPHTLIQHLHLIQSAGDASALGEFTSLIGSMGLKGVESVTLDYKVHTLIHT
jgi:gamma-tubulin complex component 2